MHSSAFCECSRIWAGDCGGWAGDSAVESTSSAAALAAGVGSIVAAVVGLVESTVVGPLLEFVTAVVMTTGCAAMAAVVIETTFGLVNGKTCLSLASDGSWALALSSLSDDVRRFDEFFTPLSMALRSSCESDLFFSS